MIRSAMKWQVIFTVLSMIMSISVFGASSGLPGFRVAGRHLYDRCGEKVILRGVNKMTVWTDINGAAFPEIAKTGANCVRIVWITNGSVDKFDAVITKCYENRMIPLVELHDATGDWAMLPEMVDWWVKPEVVDVIQKHEEYLLVNIANECGEQVSAADFKAGYTTAVTRMRDAGIHVPLIIDGGDWGKDIDVLQAAGSDLITADPDHNLLFSVHMWWIEEWGYPEAKIASEISESVEMNLPLIVGEFAHTAVGGEGVINYKLIMNECQKNEVGWLAWSWGPGNSDCEEMDMTTDNTFETLHGWALEVATTDENSIKNTSVRPKSIIDGVCEGNDITRFSVTFLATGRGSVSATPNKSMVDSGTVLAITATADENNEFINWSGDASGTDNPLTVTVDKAITVSAVFSDNGPATGAELVTNGDFSDGDNGWSFGAWEGAEGTSDIVDGEFVITMTTAGEEGWTAQLNATGLDISKGSPYAVSFKARADSAYTLSAIVGMQNDPWTAYSGYKNFSISTEMKAFSYEFTMTDSSDRDARIVFDVGNYVGNIYIDDVSIKPIEGIGIKRIPVRDRMVTGCCITHKGNGVFTFSTAQPIHGSFELYDLSGKCLARLGNACYDTGKHTASFRTADIAGGAYFIRLTESGRTVSAKMISTVR